LSVQLREQKGEPENGGADWGILKASGKAKIKLDGILRVGAERPKEKRKERRSRKQQRSTSKNEQAQPSSTRAPNGGGRRQSQRL